MLKNKLKKTNLLLAITIIGLFGICTAKSETFTARLTSDIDSVLHTFLDLPPTEENGIVYSNIQEKEFKVGDTLFIIMRGNFNEKDEERYVYMFPNHSVSVNGFHYNMNSIAAGDSLLMGDISFGKIRHFSFGFRIIIGHDVNFDLDITLHIRTAEVSARVKTVLFELEHHYEVFPAPQENFPWSVNFPANAATFPITIVPNEGHRIKSILIDTNVIMAFVDGVLSDFEGYDFSLVYDFEEEAPESTEGFTIELWGYFERDGKLYSKGSDPSGTGGWGGNYGYYIKVITEEIENSITDQTTVRNLLVAPNPTSANATVSIDLETAGNLTVTLNNMLGQELLEIYNGFTVEGNFTKTFSLKELPIGMYYLKIVHNGNVKVEKVVRN